MTEQIYEESLRPNGDLGAFFEEDSGTCYFYLFVEGIDGKILDFIKILSEKPDFSQNDIAVRWDVHFKKVGLFIFGQLWAYFDCETGEKFGGNYRPGRTPNLPSFEFLAS